MNPHDTTWQFWSDLIMLIKPFKTISTRGAYYQAESAGLVDKTDSGYNKVQRALSDMRREGLIPYSKVRDTTRARRKDWMVSTMGEAAESTLRSYRHDYWDIQPFHVEVWCEKEALSPQIEPICEEFGVFYASTRGFDSDTFTYETARQLKRVNKPIRIYYLGDHDPSGWWVAKSLESRLYEFGVDVGVYHLAVLPEQISEWHLPTRRASKTDTRYKAFVEEFGSDLAVEVDAIRPDMLGALVSDAIYDIIDEKAWARAWKVEQAQRDTTKSVMDVWAQLEPGTLLKLNGDGNGYHEESRP